MYCLPVDDLCHLDHGFQAETRQAEREFFIYEQTFTLGTFNGRRYVYTWFDKTHVILIDNAGQLSETPDILGD